MNNIKKRHFVIGTAGHIDHGKTALVKQLTGKDTDWLKEERMRGMTIDLGFAFLGENITIIDVPGHEKFVRNMVAGVSTIDLVLFVIAADDGIMPQTREHLDILKLLQIKHGIIVLTKIDLVEKDWNELVIEEIQALVTDSFLEKAPIFPISNQTGAGIAALKGKIIELATKAEERLDKGIFRLPIDRIFTMKGFGTVAAGTVLSGSIAVDQNVDLLPQKIKLRVRGLQIHEQNVASVKIGDRAAINLAGIEKKAIKRGDVLAQPDYFIPARFFDAKFYLLKSAPRQLNHNDRIRLNIGTSEQIGRISILDKNEISPGETAYLQFRMENPIVAEVGDRYVVRSYSPVMTIGGGVVLRLNPSRHKRFLQEVVDQMKILEQGDPLQMVEQILLKSKYNFIDIAQIAKQMTLTAQAIESIIQELEKKKLLFKYGEKGHSYYLHQKNYENFKNNLTAALVKFHQQNPTRRGLSKTELKLLAGDADDLMLFNVALNELVAANQLSLFENRVALATHKIQVTEQQKKILDKIASKLLEEGFVTSNQTELSEKLKIDPELIVESISIMLETGELLRLEDGIIFHREKIEDAKKIIHDYFQNNHSMTIGDLRKLLNTSRKYAVPLINYFDSIGMTIRQDDIRIFNPDFKF